MRIVHVIGNIEAKAGGPTAVLATMARCQTRAGLDVSVVSGFQENSDPKSPSPLRAAGVPVLLVGPVRGPLESHRNFMPILEGRIVDADVVHMHGVWEEILYRTTRICQRRGVPYIITPHGMLDRWSLGKKWLKKQVYIWWRLRRMLRQSAAVHTSSRAEQGEVQRLHLAPQVFVQPYGLDLTEAAALPPPGTFRRQHGLAPEQPLITFLGRIHPGKGLEYLVPAMAHLQRKGAVLAVLGPDSGGFRAIIEQMAAENHLTDRIIFTGLVTGVEKLSALADSTVLCLPSDHENFGVVIIEALGVGCPVVVSDQVNIFNEIVDAGVGSVAPREPVGLARELDGWLGNPARRAEASARAMPLVASQFDANRIASRWREQYAALSKHPECGKLKIVAGSP